MLDVHEKAPSKLGLRMSWVWREVGVWLKICPGYLSPPYYCFRDPCFRVGNELGHLLSIRWLSMYFLVVLYGFYFIFNTTVTVNMGGIRWPIFWFLHHNLQFLDKYLWTLAMYTFRCQMERTMYHEHAQWGITLDQSPNPNDKGMK